MKLQKNYLSMLGSSKVNCRALFHGSFLLLSALLLISACSVRQVYNQLDWVIPWYLDDYVSFNPAQEVLLDARLEQYLYWHRTQQLPRYAGFLEWVAESSEDGLDASELEKIEGQVGLFGDDLLNQLAPSIVEMFQGLDDDQYAELFRSFEKENAKYRKQYIELSEKKQRMKRVRDIRKFIERWTGQLDENQISLIQQWSQRYQLMGEEFVQSRLVWQQHLKRILQRRNEPDYLKRSLQELFSNRRFARSETYQQKYAYNETLLKQLYLSLDKSLSEEQRARMIRKLKKLAQDFYYLADQHETS